MKVEQTDFLGDIKASYALIERIKQYYYHRGIPLEGAKFEVVAELDHYGSKFYAIKSNLQFDVKTNTMQILKDKTSG